MTRAASHALESIDLHRHLETVRRLAAQYSTATQKCSDAACQQTDHPPPRHHVASSHTNGARESPTHRSSLAKPSQTLQISGLRSLRCPTGENSRDTILITLWNVDRSRWISGNFFADLIALINLRSTDNMLVFADIEQPHSRRPTS